MKRLKHLEDILWVLEIGADVGADREQQPPGKRWPLCRTEVAELLARARHGDDEAFFELVARDPEYLFTDAGRAKLLLWHCQKEIALLTRDRDDDGASERFVQLARALARGNRERRYDAAMVDSIQRKARKDLMKALRTYRESKERRNPHTPEVLSKLCRISRVAADVLVTAKRAGRMAEAIEAEVGARLGVGSKRARQLLASLDQVRAEGWLD